MQSSKVVPLLIIIIIIEWNMVSFSSSIRFSFVPSK